LSEGRFYQTDAKKEEDSPRKLEETQRKKQEQESKAVFDRLVRQHQQAKSKVDEALLELQHVPPSSSLALSSPSETPEKTEEMSSAQRAAFNMDEFNDLIDSISASVYGTDQSEKSSQEERSDSYQSQQQQQENVNFSSNQPSDRNWSNNISSNSSTTHTLVAELAPAPINVSHPPVPPSQRIDLNTLPDLEAVISEMISLSSKLVQMLKATEQTLRDHRPTPGMRLADFFSAKEFVTTVVQLVKLSDQLESDKITQAAKPISTETVAFVKRAVAKEQQGDSAGLMAASTEGCAVVRGWLVKMLTELKNFKS